MTIDTCELTINVLWNPDLLTIVQKKAFLFFLPWRYGLSWSATHPLVFRHTTSRKTLRPTHPICVTQSSNSPYSDFMSTLKIVLHGEKTLKTTIQKNLSKSQKFAREVSVVEFRYSQIIFLRLSVILLMLMVLWNFILKLHIQSPVEQLRLSFFVEIINVLKPLVIFAGELHRGCLTGF